MAVYRNITGLVKDAQGAVIPSGFLEVRPLQPLIDNTALLSPEEITVAITDGAFTLVLAAPNNYDFLIIDQLGETIWNFKAPLSGDVDSDITLAALYFASLTEEDTDATTVITEFLDLFDTPTSFIGEMGKYLTVKTAEDGVEFADPGTLLPFNLRLDAILDGSNLKTVGDVEGATTPLQLAEDAVKVDAAPLVVDKIAFDVASGATADAEGEMVWNAIDKTIDVRIDGAVLQAGQEFHVRVYNNTGANIYNGEVVTLSGASGTLPYAALADATDRLSSRATLGIATEDIIKDTEGMITTKGMVRGLNTAAFPPGTPLFLHASTPGALQGFFPPSPPTSVVFLGICVTQDAAEGSILVTLVTSPTLTELVDVDVSAPETSHLLVYNAAASTFENKVPSVTTLQSLSAYVDKVSRGKSINQFGGMERVVEGDTLGSGDDLALTNGCGKLVIVVNAGSDLAGDILLTGDTVNRNTGEITVGDTETVTLAGLTTDTSDTDAQGNERHGFAGAYITTNWFQGDVTISTTEVTLTDVDVYGVAFHQFGDTPMSIVPQAFDITARSTSGSGWLYGYAYALRVESGRCTVGRGASVEMPASSVTANLMMRRKIAAGVGSLDPSTDGFWVEIFAGPFNQTYWGDITTIAIYEATSLLTLS